MSAKTIKNYTVIALLAVFLFGFAVWAMLKPADAYSLSERRPLAQAPDLSVQNILSGKFKNGAEKYAVEQFPLREQFRTLKSVTSFYVMRQKANNDVYIRDGYAAQLDYPLNPDMIDHAAERFRNLYETLMKDTDVRIYLSIVPDKNFFLAEEGGYPTYDYEELVRTLTEKTDFAEYIDLFDTLEISDYYRTDSHWRQEKIQKVAQRLAEAMGVSVSDTYTETELDRDYYGVYYGYAALPMPAERIHYLESETLKNCTVTNYETGSQTSVYDLEKGNGKDPYELFLSGSVSLLTIENPDAETDRELVVFRDSYGSSLAPLLVKGYSKITLVDIRYLASPLVGQHVRFDSQDVLFLYSTSVLNNSITLK